MLLGSKSKRNKITLPYSDFLPDHPSINYQKLKDSTEL